MLHLEYILHTLHPFIECEIIYYNVLIYCYFNAVNDQLTLLKFH